MKHLYTLQFLLALTASINYSFSQTTATYDIVFTSVWNATDHGTLPGGPHWSRLVGANHNSNVTFLEMGQIATQGIEDVAELGNNSAFNSEVTTSIGNGNTEQYINGSSLGSATGTITISNLDVSEDYPLLTLVSMIAPSPDWMIAVNGVELRESGNWKSLIEIDLFPYDAGTDSGASYEAGNADTNPQDPISSLRNVAPFGDAKIGTLTITLQSVLGTNNVERDNEISFFPNPANEEIVVKNPANKPIKNVQLFDITGAMVTDVLASSGSNLERFSLRNIDTGLYLLKFNLESGTSVTRKLIVE